MVEGDRNKVGQIVANLLGNALKFTERGHIGLHVWRDAERADRVWFEVHDTGPGIAPTELADLFVPFRQGAAGQEKGGTGLGLALSRDMARAMGGDLTIASTPGVGTQVRFWLPLPASRLSSAGAPVGAGAQVLDDDTPCTVLVIEDDPDSRDVLVNLLRDVGCTVMQAFDGLEGLRALPRRALRHRVQRHPHAAHERRRDDRAPARRPVHRGAAGGGGVGVQPGARAPLLHRERLPGFHRQALPVPGRLPRAGRLRRRRAAPGRGARGDGRLDARRRWPPAWPRACASSCARWPSAASSGQLGAVGKLMEAITPEAIGGERWRAFDDAAQAYDFQLLEERVNALIAQMDVVATRTKPHQADAPPIRDGTMPRRACRIPRICVQIARETLACM